MSRGRISRANAQSPRGRRRASRYGGRGSTRPLPVSMIRPKRRRGNPIGLASRLVAGALLALLIFLVVGLSVAVAGGFAGWSYLTADLPAEGEIEVQQFETTKIYDRNWVLLHEVSDPQTGWRTSVTYQEILDNIALNKDDPSKPQRAWIFDATVAAEDATFWTNPGVDPVAIARGVMINFSGEGSSGASTITQQLVRLLYPEKIGYERSLSRKVREAITAYKFSKKHPKEHVLEMYLNYVYYGNRSYGIDAASQSYFNKHPWDLTLGEAAMLAGLPQAPSQYDPTLNFELAKARQRYVLAQMVKQEMITQAEADQAYAQPLRPENRDRQINLAPHFVNFVRYYLEQKFGADVLYRGGLTVRTTLDINMQNAAQEIAKKRVEELAAYDATNASLVAMLPWSGEIVAMVGSVDYFNDAIDGQVNVAVRERQPGSSIKPFTYLAAFERGWHPGTMIFDYAKRWPTPGAPQPYYEPRNGSRGYYGAISVRDALGASLNIPAVQALEFVGLSNMLDLSHKLGIRTGLWRGESFYGLAVTLGGGEVSVLEHTNAFATLANGGRYVPYTPLLEVTDKSGRKLYELDRAKALEKGEQVAKPEHVYQLTHVLSDNSARAGTFGARSPLLLAELNNRPAAAKTGTTENNEDNWTMGYTTDLAVGVWVGNTNNTPMRSLDGIVSAAPIWHNLMVEAHQNPELAKTLLGPDGKPLPVEFVRPPGVYEGEICAPTGHKAEPGQRNVKEILVQGGGPTLRCGELSEYEQRELKAALEDAAKNPRMLPRGQESLRAYAAAAAGRSTLGTPTTTNPSNRTSAPTPSPQRAQPQPTVQRTPTPVPQSQPQQPQPQPQPAVQPTPTPRPQPVVPTPTPVPQPQPPQPQPTPARQQPEPTEAPAQQQESPKPTPQPTPRP